MNPICPICHQQVARVQVSAGLYRWGHVENPRQNHHYVKPPRIAPETEAERREAYGK